METNQKGLNSGNTLKVFPGFTDNGDSFGCEAAITCLFHIQKVCLSD